MTQSRVISSYLYPEKKRVASLLGDYYMLNTLQGMLFSYYLFLMQLDLYKIRPSVRVESEK